MESWISSIPLNQRWKILVVGDSHVQTILPAIKTFALDIQFDFLPMINCSAEKFATMPTHQKIVVDRISATKPHWLLLMFGGIDCELLAPLEDFKGGQALQKVIVSATLYASFLNSSVNIPCFVIGVLPPTLMDYSYREVIGEEYKNLLPSETIQNVSQLLKTAPLRTLEGRTVLHQIFNKSLNEKLHNHKFVDLSSAVSQEDLQTLSIVAPPTTSFTDAVVGILRSDFRAAVVSADISKITHDLQDYVWKNFTKLNREGGELLKLIPAMNYFEMGSASNNMIIVPLRITGFSPPSIVDYTEFLNQMPVINSLLAQLGCVLGHANGEKTEIVNVWMVMLDSSTTMPMHVGYAGMSDRILRCHVPIRFKEGFSGVDIDGLRCNYQNGSIVTIDDTYAHCEYNTSPDTATLVLLIDVKRPQFKLPRSTALMPADAAILAMLSTFQSQNSKHVSFE